MVQARGWLLLTNDDGIEAIGFELLVKALHDAGYPARRVGSVRQSLGHRHAHQSDETHGLSST